MSKPMSYCQFQVWAGDLRELQEALVWIDTPGFERSPDEEKALRACIRICKEIADNLGDYVS